ncbi:MAG: histidine kinase [Candidatus Acidiferrales bacterium]
MSTPGPFSQAPASARRKSAGGPAPAQFLDIAAKDRIFREFLKVSIDIVLVLGDRGETFIDANPQLTNLLGYSKKDFRSSSPCKIFADENEIKKFFHSVWERKGTASTQMSCVHKSGRAIPATIRARLVLPSAGQAALAVIHVRPSGQQTYDHATELETVTKLLRVARKSPLAAPNLKREFDSWLRRLCRVAHFPVAHMHVLSDDLAGLAGCADVWHVARRKELDSIRSCPDCLALPEDISSRIAGARSPEIVAELNSQPQFQTSEIRGLHLKSAFAIPIVIGNEVSAISEFFSNRSADQDSLLVQVIHLLGRELGYALHHRSLALKLTKMQDEERRRLSSELHDTVAQSLSVLLLDLESVLEESAFLSERARGALARTMSLARQSLQEIRTLSYLLHPPVLDALGLLPALRVFIDGFSRRSGIRVVSEMPNSMPRMPDDWEMAVFRVVQEGLTNVQRHSHSSSAEVRVALHSGLVTVCVINEGAAVPTLETGGLPPESAGVGIGGMRERVGTFGGDVNLYCHENKTILEATVPIFKSPRSPQLPLKF